MSHIILNRYVCEIYASLRIKSYIYQPNKKTSVRVHSLVPPKALPDVSY